MRKQVLSFLLAMVLLLTAFPMPASAEVGDNEMSEIESNDSMVTADTIYNDYTVTGTLSGTDIDVFKFVLTKSSNIEVTCIADYSVLLIGLYDSDDNLLKVATQSTQNGYYYDILTESLSAGTYYLRLLNSNENYSGNFYMFYFTYASNHTHSYYSVTYPPTCDEQGYTKYICADCGEYYFTDYTDPKHTYGEWIVYKNPGCTTLGEERRTCNNCDDYESRDIDAVGHSYSNSTDTTCDSCGATRTLLNGWVEENGKWAFYKNNVKVTSCWKQDSKGWCYVGADGYMKTNAWVLDSQGWCYVGADGYCVKNCWKMDSKGWCYLDGNGRMKTNCWLKDSKGWCYLGADGYCVTNCWKQDSKGWVYLNAEGRMATSKWIQDSKGWCYVGSDGYMVTNCWVKDSSGWCYIGANGYETSHALDYCNHSFTNATCEEAATCSKCGAVNGKALPHNFTGGSCTEPATCSMCGEPKGEALGHDYEEGVCTVCGEKDPDYVPVFALGETWVVDGEWEITITGVEEHYLCNRYADEYTDEPVIIVSYTYKNIGYDDELFVSLGFISSRLYDEEGEIMNLYPCTHDKSPAECVNGTKCSASVAFALENESDQITIYFDLSDSNNDKQNAYFIIEF